MQAVRPTHPHIPTTSPAYVTGADHSWHVCVPGMDLMGVDTLGVSSSNENDCSTVGRACRGACFTVPACCTGMLGRG